MRAKIGIEPNLHTHALFECLQSYQYILWTSADTIQQQLVYIGLFENSQASNFESAREKKFSKGGFK